MASSPNPSPSGQDPGDPFSNSFPHYGPHNPPPPKKVPLWLIVVAFCFGWPMGIGLILLNIWLDSNYNHTAKGSGTARPQGSARPAPGVPAGAAPRYAAAETAGAAAPTAPSYKNIKPKKAKQKKKKQPKGSFFPTALLLCGLLGILMGASGLMEPLLWLQNGYYALGELWATLFWNSTMLLGGVGLLCSSHYVRRLQRLRRDLNVVVGQNDYMALEQICRILNCNHKTAVAAVQNAIDQGDFGPSAYLDHSIDTLIVRSRPPQAEAPKAAPSQPSAMEGESQYQSILQELRDLNDAIEGEEMSAKINRLGEISAKIFALAESSPDKQPQLRKFMNYYLPTSLKLLRTYAQLDAQGVEGANISQSKRRIEETMDTLCDAFAAQLDKLFRSEALDVSTDIAAMQTMLQQDGLATDDLTLDLSGDDTSFGAL